MPDPVRACIGLGANLGDRQANIDAALALLRDTEGVSLLASAAPVRTKAVTLSPGETQPDYLNSAALIETILAPRDLLDALLAIERTLGRDRASEKRWGPRLIDLDLLLYGDAVIDEPGLTVPHPEMHKRAFVLHPLADLAPHQLHPVLKQSMVALRDRLHATRAGAASPVRLAAFGALLTSVCMAQQPAPPADPRTEAVAILQRIAAESRSLDETQWVEIETLGPGAGETVRGLFSKNDGMTLGDVGVRWGNGTYDIWDARSDARVVTAATPAGEEMVLAFASLRPLPVSQVAFALGDDALSGPFGSIDWLTVERQGGGFVLAGKTGPYAIEIADADGAAPLDAMRVTTDSAATGQSFVVRSGVSNRPLIAPDLEDRRSVESVARLQPPAGRLGVGDDLTGLVLLDSQSMPYFGPASASAQPTLLLVVRESDPWSQEIRALLHRLAESPELAESEVRPVVVLANGDGDLAARVAERIDEWGGNLLWTVSAQSSIDLFAPDATAVAVALDPAGVVADLCIIENRASDVESLARRFTEALSQ